MKQVLFLIFIAFLFSGCGGMLNQSSYNNYTNDTQSKPFDRSEFYNTQHTNVRKNKYGKKKLMNSDEMKLYWALINSIKDLKLMVLPQVNIGSFLKHDDVNEHRLINCKRVDFCIVDRHSNPIAVVEYNGEGHYQSHSSIRDDIKRMACNSANVKFIEISFHDKNNFNKAVEEKVLPLIKITKTEDKK